MRARVTCRTEAQGAFTFKGLSEGLYRLTIAPTGVATLFSQEQLEEAAVDAPLPARDVQLVLPLAVIEVRATGPAGSEEDRHDLVSPQELSVFEFPSGNLLGKFPLDHGMLQMNTQPNQALRLELRAEGLAYDPWTGTTPPGGVGLRSVSSVAPRGTAKPWNRRGRQPPPRATPSGDLVPLALGRVRWPCSLRRRTP